MVGQAPVVVSAHDENEQSRFVAQRIADLREEGAPLSDIAVLFRSSSHSFDLEIELGRAGNSVSEVWRDEICESAHIKDALAFMRVMVKPSDTLSWFRALKLIDQIRRCDCLPDTRTSRRRAARVSLARSKPACSKNFIASLLARLTKRN
jgi:superfamily I DNA/RNA helicase